MPESAQRVALFDFDGTICAGNSLHLFIMHQWRARRARPQLLAWSILRKLRLAGSRRFKEGVLGTTVGLPVDELTTLGQAVYQQRIRPLLRTEGLREMRELGGQGYRVMIVTGAFDFLVRPFCEEYGVRDLLCCRPGKAAGRSTGRIEGGEMQGAEKETAVRATLAGQTIDWSRSKAFSDDVSDEALLAMVGEPCWVTSVAGPFEPATGIARRTWGKVLADVTRDPE